jgi:small redox-active disulfide protein 2
LILHAQKPVLLIRIVNEPEANTKEALQELGIEADIEKVESMEEIMAYGIMSTPASVVDEKVKFSGKNPSVKELKKYLQA